MEDHIHVWINAYYDGELHGERLRQAEAHLEECQLCQQELAQYRRLSALLQEAPVPEFEAPVSNFDTLPSTDQPAAAPAANWKKVFKAGWLTFPFVLIVVWALFQAGLLIAGLAGASGLSGDLWEGLAGIFLWPSLSSLVGRWMIQEAAGELSKLFPVFSPAVGSLQIALLNLIATAVTGIFLWSWIASWWVYKADAADAADAKE